VPDTAVPDTATAALLAWYAAGHRDLPWRRTRDPYAILVSEVMLQQTQVARVLERYGPWLERWPTVEALAAAARAEVLAAWVGLGYNRRALRLWEACRIVSEQGWPADLRTLPGIGPYTAAAVGSFAFGRHELAVDVNVRRVLDRFGAGLEPPPGRSAAFNQAAMELGALVCTARAARCGACPLRDRCPSRGRAPEPSRRRAAGERFEDSNRWVRGRVVAALAAGNGVPAGIAPDRLARAVEGLLEDGLVVRDRHGLSLG
jgi:A/G-specific adenine glycosylase